MIREQEIIDSYQNERSLSLTVNQLCSRFPEYFSAKPQQPEFLLEQELLSKDGTASTMQSLHEAVSHSSNLTRVHVDRVVFQDIFERRNFHKIFMLIEKENPTDKKWYVQHENQEIKGPYNTFEMDKLYQSFELTKKTRIKTKEDDHYQLLGRYVKRYYKQFVEEKLSLQRRKEKLSEKISNFKKGEVKFKKLKRVEYYRPRQRTERVFSLNSQPSLVFLNDLLPENEDEDQNSFYHKLRSHTLNQ